MNPVRQAIYAALSADATLTGLLSTPTAIHHQRAPQTATYPLVVFHRQVGRPQWAFAGSPLQWDLWLLKAVDKSNSATRAEDIAARIDEVLNDAQLAVTGRAHLYLRRESDVDYAEADGDITYRYVGGLYRLVTEET